MKLSTETLQYQTQLADYCKSGVVEEIPGVTPNRIHHYRRLITNIIRDILENSFPIAYSILSDQEWDTLVEDFFAKHKIKTPQVWKMPIEFYEFVRDNNYAELMNRPYLSDLLYFEWIEIDVYTMEDIASKPYKQQGSMDRDVLVFNPEYRLIQLEYPVHTSKESDLVASKGNYVVLIFRDVERKRVNFINMGLFPAMVVEIISSDGIILEDATKIVSEKLQMTYTPKFKTQMVSIFEDLREKGFVLGFEVYS